jgi:hypothetical protein
LPAFLTLRLREPKSARSRARQHVGFRLIAFGAEERMPFHLRDDRMPGNCRQDHRGGALRARCGRGRLADLGSSGLSLRLHGILPGAAGCPCWVNNRCTCAGARHRSRRRKAPSAHAGLRPQLRGSPSIRVARRRIRGRRNRQRNRVEHQHRAQQAADYPSQQRKRSPLIHSVLPRIGNGPPPEWFPPPSEAKTPAAGFFAYGPPTGCPGRRHREAAPN